MSGMGFTARREKRKRSCYGLDRRDEREQVEKIKKMDVMGDVIFAHRVYDGFAKEFAFQTWRALMRSSLESSEANVGVLPPESIECLYAFSPPRTPERSRALRLLRKVREAHGIKGPIDQKHLEKIRNKKGPGYSLASFYLHYGDIGAW